MSFGDRQHVLLIPVSKSNHPYDPTATSRELVNSDLPRGESSFNLLDMQGVFLTVNMECAWGERTASSIPHRESADLPEACCRPASARRSVRAY
jgi:hypothetical protein